MGEVERKLFNSRHECFTKLLEMPRTVSVRTKSLKGGTSKREIRRCACGCGFSVIIDVNKLNGKAELTMNNLDAHVEAESSELSARKRRLNEFEDAVVPAIDAVLERFRGAKDCGPRRILAELREQGFLEEKLPTQKQIQSHITHYRHTKWKRVCLSQAAVDADRPGMAKEDTPKRPPRGRANVQSASERNEPASSPGDASLPSMNGKSTACAEASSEDRVRSIESELPILQALQHLMPKKSPPLLVKCANIMSNEEGVDTYGELRDIFDLRGHGIFVVWLDRIKIPEGIALSLLKHLAK